ncbi:kinase-like domain-containing protein [Mycena epipterygia]|nr:kinase-like domain-containing protein [Mycena epipterygia]
MKEMKGGLACVAEANQGQAVGTMSREDTVPTTFKDRAAKTALRFKLQASKPGTTLNTAALIHHERGSSNGSTEQIMLAISTRIGGTKSIDSRIGHIIHVCDVLTAMPDILFDCLEAINPQFLSSNVGPWPLIISEVSFRFASNRLPEPNSVSGTLAEFYKIHSSTTDKVAIYLETVPPHFKSVARGKKKLMCLEFCVNLDLYRERVENASDTDEPAGETRGRKRTISTSSTVSAVPKRIRLSLSGAGLSAVGSQFSFRGRSVTPLTVKTRSNVTLQKFTVGVDTFDFSPELLKHDIQLDGLMRDSHFAHGQMKVAFDLAIVNTNGKEERYVAKRLYRTSEDQPQTVTRVVDCADNRAYLEADAFRLALGEHLLHEFYECAKEQEVPVYQYLKFTQAFLGEELPVQVTRMPSVASGVQDGFLDDVVGPTWLIEPKRASQAIISYTTTLNHAPRGLDFTAKTVHAFAHYTFGSSESSLVFADLQGTSARVDGNDGVILLRSHDTHTQRRLTCTGYRGSGLGDFGTKGLETFIETHRCNELCRKLQFDKKFPLELMADIPGPEPTEGSQNDDEMLNLDNADGADDDAAQENGE